MPVGEPRGPAHSDLCCFCGEGVEQSESGWIRLAARWVDGGQERTQSWSAHHGCLAGRIHPVARTGPFFGDAAGR